ncbi:hypothetical protein APHAL10511_003458 [Amanita phalloides]|nr:hypothetical protein APHAL10511_003458 [Amanita phalloides]
MAKYNYDDAGNMAAYFLITFLALILIPASFSALAPGSDKSLDGCNCSACADRRRWLAVRSRRSVPLTKKAVFLLLGWSLLAFVSYRVVGAVVENKVYDPFEILGINTDTSEKEIKAHFKKLSRMYHPDKVKVTVNQTIEIIQEKFVEITKAYKSLTDETIRKNWELYGNPDGRQEMSMGIALPQWIVESKNNVWVLSVYGLLFGGALPALVGRWWFGNREITKDGVRARSAAEFFKSLREESGMNEVVTTLGKSFSWELSPKSSSSDVVELQRLEREISNKAGKVWKTVESVLSPKDEARRRGIILIYAHMLRIGVKRLNLVTEQAQILQQAPLLLNALLNITLSRNWLFPSLDIMRLHAYLVQALPPSMISFASVDGKPINPRASIFAQLPGISSPEEANAIAPSAAGYPDFIRALEEKADDRLTDTKTALARWGHLDLVNVSFKVIGERVVSPSAIVYLLVKLRLKSPLAPQPSNTNTNNPALDADQIKHRIRQNQEREEEFLKSRGDAEDVPDTASSYAHAPHWPGTWKPSWWIVLADEKSNRVVVPPLKISDIPHARLPEANVEEAELEQDYRAYKFQFQGPPNVGVFTWKVYIVSDTFVGEEVTRDITNGLTKEKGSTLASIVGSRPRWLTEWESFKLSPESSLRLSFSVLPTQFYAMFWGKSMADEEKKWRDAQPPMLTGIGNERQGGDGSMDVDVSEEEDDIIEGCHFLEIDIEGFEFPRIWIRAEYIRIYDALMALYRTPAYPYLAPAVVITGQPGIGKSIWIYYALRRRLAERKPVIWYYRKTRYDAKGGVPENLVMRHTRHFVIYCSSPSQDRWSRLHKTVRDYVFIMNPWKSKEILRVTSTLPPGAILHESVNRVFNEFGPTPRLCIDYLCYDKDKIEQYRKDVQEAISNLTANELQRLFQHSHSLTMDAISHKICLISREDRENVRSSAIVSPITSFIKSRLANHFRTLERGEKIRLYKYFSKVPDSRATAGIFFEAAAQGCFQDGITLELLPMVRLPPSQRKPQWYSSHVFLHNPTLEAERQQALQNRRLLSLSGDLPTVEYTDDDLSSIIPDVIYVPKSTNQVALDCFIHSEEVLYMFQFSVGQDHDIKSGLIDFIRKCSGRPLSMDRCRFVFIHPPNHTLVCPQPRDPEMQELHPWSAVLDFDKL